MAIGKNITVNKPNEQPEQYEQYIWGRCDNTIQIKSCDTNANIFKEIGTNDKRIWEFSKNDNDNHSGSKSIVSETDTNGGDDGGSIWR